MAVSDLCAEGAPSEELASQLNALFGPCALVSVMAVCVGITGCKVRSLKMGIYCFTAMEWVCNVGYEMFSWVSGAASTEPQNVMHFIVTILIVALSLAFLFSLVLSILCFIFLDPLCRFLGSDELLLYYCRQYMIPGLISIPFAVFGMMFQISFITVGKASRGAFLSVFGGVLNIVLDWLFMGVFGWGLTGAAIATSIGYAVPSVVGVLGKGIGHACGWV